MKLELLEHAGKTVGYNLVPDNPAEEKAVKKIGEAYHDGAAILEDYGHFYHAREWGKTKSLQFLREKYEPCDIKSLKKTGEVKVVEAKETPQEYLVCSECGGKNVQVRAWVYPNDNNSYASDIDDGEAWCENCDEHVSLNLVKNKKRKGKQNYNP